MTHCTSPFPLNRFELDARHQLTLWQTHYEHRRIMEEATGMHSDTPLKELNLHVAWISPVTLAFEQLTVESRKALKAASPHLSANPG